MRGIGRFQEGKEEGWGGFLQDRWETLLEDDVGEEEVESGNPYVFQDENLTIKFKTPEGMLRN